MGTHAGGAAADVMAARPSVPDHVAFRDFGTETVVLNLATGKYHGLNATGGRILAALVSTEDLRQATAALADDYQQPYDEVERDVRAFCVDMLARGLLEIEFRGAP